VSSFAHPSKRQIIRTYRNQAWLRSLYQHPWALRVTPRVSCKQQLGWCNLEDLRGFAWSIQSNVWRILRNLHPTQGRTPSLAWISCDDYDRMRSEAKRRKKEREGGRVLIRLTLNNLLPSSRSCSAFAGSM